MTVLSGTFHESLSKSGARIPLPSLKFKFFTRIPKALFMDLKLTVTIVDVTVPTI